MKTLWLHVIVSVCEVRVYDLSQPQRITIFSKGQIVLLPKLNSKRKRLPTQHQQHVG